MLKSFGAFTIRKERMYRGQPDLPNGSGGRKKVDTESRETNETRAAVNRMIANDPDLAERLNALKKQKALKKPARIPRKRSSINSPEQIAKRAKAIKARKGLK